MSTHLRSRIVTLVMMTVCCPLSAQALESADPRLQPLRRDPRMASAMAGPFAGPERLAWWQRLRSPESVPTPGPAKGVLAPVASPAPKAEVSVPVTLTPEAVGQMMRHPVYQRLAAFIGRYNRQLTTAQRYQLADVLLRVSETYQVDYRLLVSMIAVESSFRPNALSSSGAIGLGQLKPDTARWLGVKDPWDPISNLQGASQYMRYLLDRFDGDLDKAVAAYYEGPNAIASRGVSDKGVRYLLKVNESLQSLKAFLQPQG